MAQTLTSQCRGPGFYSLVKELDPTCHNQGSKILDAATKTWDSQMN